MALNDNIRSITLGMLLSINFESHGKRLKKTSKHLSMHLTGFTTVWRQPRFGYSTSINDESDEPIVMNYQPPVSVEILEELLLFYDRFALEYRDRKDLRISAAQANTRIGDIQRQLGESAAA